MSTKRGAPCVDPSVRLHIQRDRLLWLCAVVSTRSVVAVAPRKRVYSSKSLRLCARSRYRDFSAGGVIKLCCAGHFRLGLQLQHGRARMEGVPSCAIPSPSGRVLWFRRLHASKSLRVLFRHVSWFNGMRDRRAREGVNLPVQARHHQKCRSSCYGNT